MPTLTIDGISVTVPDGTSILDAAEQAGISIPVVCYHPHLTANGLCRVCSVEVTGWRLQAAACVTACQDGMQVHTQTEGARLARQTILEMLASTVDVSNSPEILPLLAEYSAEPEKFSGEKRRESPVYADNPFYIRDYNQCINCWRCVQVCAEDAQFAFALNFNGRGFDTRIATFENDPMPDTTCVFCGQCVGVCPTGALLPTRQALLQEGLNPDEVVERTRAKRKNKR